MSVYKRIKSKTLGDRKVSGALKKGIVKRVIDPSTCVVEVLEAKPHKKYKKIIRKKNVF